MHVRQPAFGPALCRSPAAGGISAVRKNTLTWSSEAATHLAGIPGRGNDPLVGQLYFRGVPVFPLPNRSVGIFNAIDYNFLVKEFVGRIGQTSSANYIDGPIQAKRLQFLF